ncbi:RNA methyltransferase, putative [Perkinsus marinus ATCC 50983]|uniref:RNA methyltransferase, putative n=1 Tax=Perkinsus marinus (strain ATCC 50983 / TXsc) TaxID=423536 RepID=C5LC97_PERM5|nr:RNA methyltransferase, putative [Perkinsus marinus ATCC 50983]EER05580.1 RNA methyltransferase, putative [Perkinsus marinus ATCC 50983]|eukprot:XP_002773764.1 RNA methyltransferase, putative [Perkinsus marinus ATCC 50983]
MVYVNGYFLSFTKYIVRLRKSRKFREEQERVFVKGLDTIRTIAAAGQKFDTLMVVAENPSIALEGGVAANRTLRVPRDLLEHITYNHHFNAHLYGVTDERLCVGDIEMPKHAEIDWESGVCSERVPTESFPEIVLCLDGLQYTDNVGRLLKTAWAVGVSRVVLTPESCDPWDWKVLEESGAKYWDKMPIHTGVDAVRLLKFCAARQLLPVVATSSGVGRQGTEPLPTVKKLNVRNAGYRGVMVVVGSEARGPSMELLECCTRVTLPMSMAADSLNASVAGGVLLYDIALRLQEEEEKRCSN